MAVAAHVVSRYLLWTRAIAVKTRSERIDNSSAEALILLFRELCTASWIASEHSCFLIQLECTLSNEERSDVYPDLRLVLICTLSDSLVLQDLPGAPLFGSLAKTDRSLGMAGGIRQA